MVRPHSWCETLIGPSPEISRHSPSIGDVKFVDHDVAIASNLSYVNNAGNVVLKVDDNSFVSDGQQRDSVRISSMDSFDLGTLWVMDAYHVPYGCRYVAGSYNNSPCRSNISSSVWGAYWSVGVDLGWPNGNPISYPCSFDAYLRSRW